MNKGAHPLEINDISTTQIQIIECLEKALILIENHLKQSGNNAGLNELKFLINWNTYDEEQKQQKYARFSCHEVNFYIYMKDKEYFERVVKPFLTNKFEKTFMDYFLLGKYKFVTGFKDAVEFSKLNAFEKVLLLAVLVKEKDEDAHKVNGWIMSSSIKNDVPKAKQYATFDKVFAVSSFLEEEKKKNA